MNFGYGRFKCCFWECYVVFHMLFPQFPKTTGKISYSPIHYGLMCVTYIYPWCIGEWPPYTQIMVFTFTLWKSLYFVIDLKLIDIINVNYMFYWSYLSLILLAFSKMIAKWKKIEKQRIVDFDGKWRPDRLYGDGVWGGQNILPYIILGPFREIWEYVREISGNSQGENVPECGDHASVPSRTVLWDTDDVVRAAISIPHL